MSSAIRYTSTSIGIKSVLMAACAAKCHASPIVVVAAAATPE
jgi:hypothetical protein